MGTMDGGKFLMNKDGYFFYCSDVFQKPLKLEFIPKDEKQEPKERNDFNIEIEGKSVSLEKAEIVENASSLKYQRTIVLILKFFWIAFAIVMCVLALLALKLADYKMIFFAIGSLFFSMLSDFIGTKLTFKKAEGKNLKLTLSINDTKTDVFILIKDNEEDLKVLFPSLFEYVPEQTLDKNENFD